MQHQKSKGTGEQGGGEKRGGDQAQQSSNTTRTHGIQGPKGGKEGGHDEANHDPRPGKSADAGEPARPGGEPRR